MDLISWWWNPLVAIIDFGGWVVVLGALFLWGYLFPADTETTREYAPDRTPEEEKKRNAEWKRERDLMRDIERGRFFGR